MDLRFRSALYLYGPCSQAYEFNALMNSRLSIFMINLPLKIPILFVKRPSYIVLASVPWRIHSFYSMSEMYSV